MADSNTYQPYASPTTVDMEKSPSPRTPFIQADPTPGHEAPGSSRRVDPPPTNLYWKLSQAFGFKGRYSLALFLICGGALLGDSLSRFEVFSISSLREKISPGQWFWYRDSLHKPNIMIHIWTVTIGCIMSGSLFIPSFQTGNRAILHRINGYITFLLILISMVTGIIVTRRSMGGELNTQTAFFFSGVMVTFSLLMGIAKVKDIPAHRAWMLRAIVYLGSIVTARIVKQCAAEIITHIGTFYAAWTCDEIEFVFGDDVSEFREQFPQCTAPYIAVAIKASMSGSRLNRGSADRCTFGMALWVGLLIHAVAVEVYLNLSK